MKTTYSGNWKSDAHTINGTKGSHYDLAQWLEGKGFEVLADSDDNERSIIARPGEEDFGEREIGEIIGDSEAVVKITVSLEVDPPPIRQETSVNGTTISILREGTVWAKASKTDLEFQEFYVREVEIEGVEGKHLEYMHPQFSRVFELPVEWTTNIKWNS